MRCVPKQGRKPPYRLGRGGPGDATTSPGPSYVSNVAASLRGLNPERAPWRDVSGQCSSLAENMDVVLGCGLLEWGH